MSNISLSLRWLVIGLRRQRCHVTRLEADISFQAREMQLHHVISDSMELTSLKYSSSDVASVFHGPSRLKLQATVPE